MQEKKDMLFQKCQMYVKNIWKVKYKLTYAKLVCDLFCYRKRCNDIFLIKHVMQALK